MSVCSACYDAGNIVDECSGGIQFNSLPEGTYNVYVQHNGTQKIQSFNDIEVGVDGVALVEGVKINNAQGYTLWATTTTAGGARQDITIGEDTFTCITFSIIKTGDTPDVVNLTE